MATNVSLDDELICEALKISGHRTNEAIVTEALEEYIKRRRQIEIINIFNKIDCDEDCNDKKQRRVS